MKNESKKRRVLAAILSFLCAYLLGIVVCVVVTPVEVELAGKLLWPLYPVLSVFGYPAYYFYLTPTYVTGPVQEYWLLGALGFLPIIYGIICLVKRAYVFPMAAPFLIGFPIGFVGTLGAYYSAAASI